MKCQHKGCVAPEHKITSIDTQNIDQDQNLKVEGSFASHISDYSLVASTNCTIDQEMPTVLQLITYVESSSEWKINSMLIEGPTIHHPKKEL